MDTATVPPMATIAQIKALAIIAEAACEADYAGLLKLANAYEYLRSQFGLWDVSAMVIPQVNFKFAWNAQAQAVIASGIKYRGR